MARLPYVIPYDPDFLGDGFVVPLPEPRCQGRLYRGGEVIDYIHFSLVQHKDRKIALYTAHNIDVAQRRSVPRTSWSIDPRMDGSTQTGPAAYVNNPFDRGHLVRRAAVAWGSWQRAKDASDSTFYYPNAAPQHENFNQDEWVDLEDWVLQSAGNISSRLCVLTGPIYTLRDIFNNGTRIPSAFWKVVVIRDPTAEGDDLAALGFVMKQNELWQDWNGAEFHNLELYQVGLREIGGYAGIDFGNLAALDEFEWRQPRFRDRSRMEPIPIDKPEDIRFFGDRRRARGIRALRLAGEIGDGPIATPRAVEKRDCGCDEPTPVSDGFEALSRQVEALRDVVDSLLAEHDLQTDDERVEVRNEARAAYYRIVGGQSTAPAEFPDCACIGSDASYGSEWFCSGVLVHERVVLTAAHCAADIDKVYVGGRSINLTSVHGEVLPVERAIVHPDYDPDGVPSHDIAVLILATPATTTPVAIASADAVNGEDNVTLVGFGYEHPTENVGFGTKRKVDVPLTNLTGFSDAEVAAAEAIHGFDNDFELHAGRKMLGKDSCNGDSGGPAYILDSAVHKVAAVTSRAAFSSVTRCGDGGIYTRIAPYMSWVRDVTGGLVGAGSDTSDPPAVSTPQTLLYVSAAQPNPSGPDKGNEWVEVTNLGCTEVSLGQYFLSDKQGGRQTLSGAVSPGGVRRITLPKKSPVKLANAGDEIVLLDGEREVHRVSYVRAGSGEIIRFDAPEQPLDGDSDVTLPDADPC